MLKDGGYLLIDVILAVALLTSVMVLCAGLEKHILAELQSTRQSFITVFSNGNLRRGVE